MSYISPDGFALSLMQILINRWVMKWEEIKERDRLAKEIEKLQEILNKNTTYDYKVAELLQFYKAELEKLEKRIFMPSNKLK